MWAEAWLSAGQGLSGFYISPLPPNPSPDFCRKLARQELELKYKATLTVAWVPKVTGMEALPLPWPPGSLGKGFQTQQSLMVTRF